MVTKPSPVMLNIAIVQLGNLIEKLKKDAPEYLIEAANGLLVALKRYREEK